MSVTMGVLLCEGGVSYLLLLSAEEMRDFRVSYSYIYRGFLVISGKPSYIWVGFRIFL